jgi:1,4-dihydroxy-2-naphthoyl-CoA synthase
MGLVNTLVPPDKLEEQVDKWCDEVLAKSPCAIKGLKRAFNVISAEIRGLEVMGFDSIWSYYATEESK